MNFDLKPDNVMLKSDELSSHEVVAKLTDVSDQCLVCLNTYCSALFSSLQLDRLLIGSSVNAE